ncbi:hypothetical protein DVA86_02955 [Streptomyces armeniacus]|uniref:Uncharacterized protein n=1 Tax=Streptomyces armeniacus TaxID=83291 RepID=A0A345XJE7_9ACTN|nr:hypothetical protein [Streptomyces armeniacus]AXK31763.1 hypothetical protein DVA86_02955 [Streptomyces armeniacus]
MSEELWKALAATPVDELERRAVIAGELADVPARKVGSATRYAWNDGGGQSAVWYFVPDGRVLLLTFDHETALNLYAEGDYALQESLYDGVPEDLVRLVRDRPENYESLNLKDEETGATIHYAGGVFWYDGEQWRPADGLMAHCERSGLDMYEESGFGFCLQDCLLGREFTPEAVVEHRAAECVYGDDDDRQKDLADVREIFARR